MNAVHSITPLSAIAVVAAAYFFFVSVKIMKLRSLPFSM